MGQWDIDPPDLNEFTSHCSWQHIFHFPIDRLMEYKRVETYYFGDLTWSSHLLTKCEQVTVWLLTSFRSDVDPTSAG